MDQDENTTIKKGLSPEHIAKMKAGRKKWESERKAKQLEILKNAQPKITQGIYAPAETIKEITEADIKLDSGAGRPTVQKGIEKSREDIIHKIYSKKDKILDAHIAAATGLRYLAADGKHVYTQKPDVHAGEYLLNQLIGKPKESVEIKTINLNVDI